MSDLDTIEVLVIKRLRDLARMKGKNQLIPVSEIFSSMRSFFRISEEEEWAVLSSLEDKCMIEIVPSKGIKLRT